MPATSEDEARAMVESIEKLVEINNQFYSGNPLSFSIGLATGVAGERLEEVVKRADAAMYEKKKEYYSAEAVDRRRRGSTAFPPAAL
jgi:PleD family two-component response regulator